MDNDEDVISIVQEDVTLRGIRQMQYECDLNYRIARDMAADGHQWRARYWQGIAANTSRKTRICLMLLMGATWDEAWRA